MPGSSTFENLNILGIQVSVMKSSTDAINYISRRIEFKQRTTCIAINPEKVYRAIHDRGLLSILEQADLRICDGVGIEYAARILYGRRIRRFTGVRLFFQVIEAAEARGWSIFLLGGSEQSGAMAVEKLRKTYPKLKILGRSNGFFEESKPIIDQINSLNPDILLVAMGSPKQEYWIGQYMKDIKAKFLMGVGGSLDVVSGKVKWAPKFCRVTGTEFLYRLFKEPRRWRRQLILPKFVMLVLLAKLFGGKNYQVQSLPKSLSREAKL